MICPNCGGENDNQNMFCAHCGCQLHQALPESKIRCPNCGGENDAKNMACVYCGNPLRRAQPEIGYANTGWDNDSSSVSTPGDSYVWGFLVLYFIQCFCLDWIIYRFGEHAFLLALVAVCVAEFVALCEDRRLLQSNRITPPHWGWILICPVYLWMRGNILKDNKLHFWIWLIILISSFGFDSLVGNI